ncbi:hypothetical protein [Parafrankia discariae]|uniref:hypothetical protein n=1 Tax=Parafrankia discariae TaxID=365528 RepID=UPI00035FB76F|nr:hypothetical protein [Parafrankia discariae]
MANFSSKVQEMLRSPKARQMVDKARAAANRPENREKIRQLSSKITSRGKSGAGAGHDARLGPDLHSDAHRSDVHRSDLGDLNGAGHSGPGTTGTDGHGAGAGTGSRDSSGYDRF